jgi:hypothetical protein
MGWVLVGVPVCTSVIDLLLPAQLGTLVALAAIVGTVVLVGVDAKRLGQSAAPHVLFAALLWVVGFPFYMRRRALWGPPNRLPHAIVAVVVLTAVPFVRPLLHADRAVVHCVPVGNTVAEGLDCTLEHTQGNSPLYMCWDVFLTCANGPGGSAHACGTVSPRASSHVEVPASGFVGAQGCDRPTKVEVRNEVVEY